MDTLTIGIREFKTRLGAYMRRVQAGAVVTITDRGKPVARIIPIKTSAETQVQELVQAGLLEWSGQKLVRRAPVARARGKTTIADLLVEDRE